MFWQLSLRPPDLTGEMSHFNTDPSYAGAMAVPPLQNYSRPQIDLSEWIGHRVLAFKEGVYHIGAIIHVTHDTCDVTGSCFFTFSKTGMLNVQDFVDLLAPIKTDIYLLQVYML